MNKTVTAATSKHWTTPRIVSSASMSTAQGSKSSATVENDLGTTTLGPPS